MNQFLKNAMKTHQVDCPACGSSSISSRSEIERFQYGDKEDEGAILSAQIQIHHCESCDFSFTTEEASEARHEAVCRHLGVFTPKEVRSVREQYSMSQAEFSELAKIGKASLARWESGSLIQNQANDNLLYLLTYADNKVRLQEKGEFQKAGTLKLAANVIVFRPKFRSITDSEVERLTREADKFELFPAAMEG